MREQETMPRYKSGDPVWYFPISGNPVEAMVKQISASGKRVYIRVENPAWMGVTSIYVKPTSLCSRCTLTDRLYKPNGESHA